MEFLNILILGNIEPGDVAALFPKGESIEAFRPEEVDIFDLLVKLGAFPSKSQARKNWKGPTEIPQGWSEFTIGKMKRKLCIWNPSVRLGEFKSCRFCAHNKGKMCSLPMSECIPEVFKWLSESSERDNQNFPVNPRKGCPKWADSNP